MKEINTIIKFVNGDIAIAEFMKQFQSSGSLQKLMHDKLPTKLINQGELIRSNGSIVDCFNNIKWKTIFGGFVVHALCMDWLEGNNIDCVPTQIYRDEFSFSLKVLPNYVGGEQAESIVSAIILSIPNTISQAKRIKQIKDKIKECFRYDSRPPRWIQSPEWPFSASGKPLLFRGQSKDEIHCQIVKFYFYDPDNGKELVVEQLY